MKKLISLLSATAVLLSAAAIPASAEYSRDFYEIVKGRDLDFNGDGTVNVGDLGIYNMYYFYYLNGEISYDDIFDKLIDFDDNGEIDLRDMGIMSTVIRGRLTDYLPGDVNLDGVINGSDATLALNCYTQLSAGIDEYTIPYYDLIKGYGDMDGDGKITGSDATVILNIYTKLSSQ